MLGSRTGLAARLKEVNCRIISIHCICQKLALACVDTAKDVEYIGTVKDLLRQLWKYLENSPKRMAVYLKVQQEVQSFDLSKKSRKVITKKLKKACQTRWLSLDQAVQATFETSWKWCNSLWTTEENTLSQIRRMCVYSQAHSSCPLSAEQNIPKRTCKLQSHFPCN